jgi:hypothetical protein
MFAETAAGNPVEVALAKPVQDTEVSEHDML